MPDDTDETDRRAVGLCTYRIPTDLHWIFRPQDTSDFGVDAQVETKDGANPTGRLLGLQIKGGASWFDQPYEDGWVFRPKSRHIQYWLGHSLPMFLLLVDLDTETIYWQEISERTLTTGPRGGIILRVPRANLLGGAAGPWRAAADRVAEAALDHYDDNLEHLSPSTVTAIRRAAEAHPGPSALLAAHLARGRRTPELTARTILASEPPWFSDNGAKGYLAVANYALGHQLADVAVETLIHVANADPPSARRHLTSAAFVINQSNPERARSLLDEARSLADGFDARIEICELALAHPADSASPVIIPPELDAQLVAIEDDADVASFLSRQRERTNRIDEAVEFGERALALDPGAWPTLEGLASILARRSQTPHAQTTDIARSVELAEIAVDQLHRWDGPTEHALRTLLSVLANAAKFTKILDRALPPEAGQARADEANRPEVILKAEMAARALTRIDLANSLIEQLPDGVDKRYALLRHRPSADAGDELRQQWSDIIDELDDNHAEQVIQAVLHLADLGVDRSDRLDSMLANGLITAGLRDLVVAIALASANLDGGLPSLRVLANTIPAAAQKLVEFLENAERWDDAERACDAAYISFHQPHFLVERARLLVRLDRLPDAERLAYDALATTTLSTPWRMSAHQLLARIASRATETASGDGAVEAWRRAENHFAECVSGADGIPASDSDVWALVLSQYRLSALDRARATLLRHDPEIRDLNDARLWLQIVITAQISVASFARMLDLADRFIDDPQFSGALLGTVIGRTRDTGDAATAIDPRIPLPDELRAQAFAALTSHIEHHGDASPFQIIESPTTEGLVAQMTEMMRRDESPLIELSETIARVQAPLGLMAAVVGRPYASVLAQRHLGYFIAAAVVDEDDNADELSAAQALGQDIVVDASSLLVSSLLGEFTNLRGLFRDLLVPRATHQDIISGRLDLDGRAGASGWLRYDAEHDSIAVAAPDIEAEVATLKRLSLIEDALTHARVVQGVTLESLGEAQVERSESWLGPIALAKERGLSIWSDDVAIRRLARSVGVEAFGTTTLLQLRADTAIHDVDADPDSLEAVLDGRRQEVLRALAERVVDISTDVGTLIEQGRMEIWAPGLAVSTLGRPGWWQLALAPWNDLQQILAAVHDDGGDVDGWQAAAMWGVTRLVPEDPSAMAFLLACVAMVAPATSANAERSAAMFEIAGQIATRRGARSPLDFLSQAATELAAVGLVADPQSIVTDLRAAEARMHPDGPPDPGL